MLSFKLIRRAVALPKMLGNYGVAARQTAEASCTACGRFPDEPAKQNAHKLTESEVVATAGMKEIQLE